MPERPYKFDDAAKEGALADCRKWGNKSSAAEAANVSLETLQYYINNDPEFGAAWDAARAAYIKSLEKEAHRRAVDGWDEQRMGPMGAYDVRKYDGSLLTLLLRANDPSKYREQVKIDQDTTVRGALNLDALSAESRAKLREILEAEASGKQQKPEGG